VAKTSLKMNRIVSLSIAAVCLLAAQDPPTHGEWGDLGHTYANPILPADFSDLDAIRVGKEYYAISSTLQYSPGVAVLHSKDLVNWQIAGHVVPDLRQIGPDLNWDRMNRAGRGIWAGAIRFHNGKYWVYFTTPDEGLFMSTAINPAGPWEPLKAVWRVSGWDDPCPFWDDDGQAYLVITNFARSYKIHLFKLDATGERLLPGSDRIIHQSRGSEANKLYKFNGLYYHYYSEVRPEGRVSMMERAHNLNGPWEFRQLIHVNPALDKEPNQGGLVQIPSGDWYFVTHQGTGDWEGRAAVLLPVSWTNGWPILGVAGKDGIGNMVWRGVKPVTGFPELSPWASDDFSQKALRPEWEWNYQPLAEKWSLSERPGYLRLHAFRPLRAGDFRTVGNILSQRVSRTTRNQVTAVFDTEAMADGQFAGLAHYARTYCAIGVACKKSVRAIILDDEGKKLAGPDIHQSRVWLRSTWDFNGESRFSYSLNGHDFHDFGPPYQLTWGAYRGDRIGLFTLNESSDKGYIDVGDFSYTISRKLP
jgi:beta-xylosidase